MPRLGLRPRSLVITADIDLGVVKLANADTLALLVPPNSSFGDGFQGQWEECRGCSLLVGPLRAAFAALLRAHFAWLRPSVLGLRTSAGLGDRLGLAASGHIEAVRAAGGDIAPILAQQSIREMERTGRSPVEVLDDAMWGVFAEGWVRGFGADADHLKTTEDIDACVAAGYTFFTFDPGAHVNSQADMLEGGRLAMAFAGLPWERLADSPRALVGRYAGVEIDLGDVRVPTSEEGIMRAAVKYGAAVAHAASLARHLRTAAAATPTEVEISVDETETPTTHLEHIYIARELRRMGVEWISLAPVGIKRSHRGQDPASVGRTVARAAVIVRRSCTLRR